MKHQNKKFERDLYDISDGPGRNAAIGLFTQFNFKLCEDQEKFSSHDLVFSRKNQTLLLEVEVKRIWNDTEFPFSSVDIPERKKHSKAGIYVMFNNQTNRALIVAMDTIKNSQVVRKNTRNKYNNTQTQDEPFYRVEKNKFAEYINIDGVWQKL